LLFSTRVALLYDHRLRTSSSIAELSETSDPHCAASGIRRASLKFSPGRVRQDRRVVGVLSRLRPREECILLRLSRAVREVTGADAGRELSAASGTAASMLAWGMLAGLTGSSTPQTSSTSSLPAGVVPRGGFFPQSMGSICHALGSAYEERAKAIAIVHGRDSRDRICSGGAVFGLLLRLDELVAWRAALAARIHRGFTCHRSGRGMSRCSIDGLRGTERAHWIAPAIGRGCWCESLASSSRKVVREEEKEKRKRRVGTGRDT